MAVDPCGAAVALSVIRGIDILGRNGKEKESEERNLDLSSCVVLSQCMYYGRIISALSCLPPYLRSCYMPVSVKYAPIGPTNLATYG